ncbi:LapA family protein [Streptomyces sp. NBC_00083]|uniref:LapA family protein n=1 Tax=Streptomyces sp. NBC_00083 TaxID=2975647 RepID=UPI00224DDD43|nr:LapA family protein [Streptomyces sp. NBC_00083]MCX5386567.1 LapA family protein [Streptomyces sp. NBC_00083]
MSPKGESSSTQGRAGGVVTPARIAVLVLAVLALVFIFENTRRVKIRLLIPEVTMPLYLALLAVFVVGLCCGYFLRRRNR